ncbi:MAG: hydroxymethylglutaryl-CoA synthase [Pseudomonadota bacterium]
MTPPENPVGIDAIAFAGPQCFLDMRDLAQARNIDPDKFTLGLGQEKMAVATPCEDTVTLAAKAAQNALTKFDIDPDEIGTLIVGTETGVDHAKPVAVYVHELLGLPTNCRTFETKHACFGGMAGVGSSADWIASGRARGRKALIIASDIARYGLQTAGEPTQGAGAVALVVGQNPRLMNLHLNCIGDYTRQVMDFWRPLYSKYAFADGHYSIQCYLDALEGALADAKSQIDDPHQLNTDAMEACFYHVPFVKMARKAHKRHVELQHDVMNDKAIDESYRQRVAPWLTLNANVGNIYTGSIFLALIDFLRRVDEGKEGRNTSFFAYGSGCGASYSAGQVAPGAAAYKHLVDPAEQLAARRRLTVEEYEELMREEEHADENEAGNLDPTRWRLDGDLFYLGTHNHQRRYGDLDQVREVRRAG